MPAQLHVDPHHVGIIVIVGHVCIVERQHEKDHGNETGGYKGIHATSRFTFRVFGDFNFNRRCREPIEKALNESNPGREVFKFVVVLEESLEVDSIVSGKRVYHLIKSMLTIVRHLTMGLWYSSPPRFPVG